MLNFPSSKIVLKLFKCSNFFCFILLIWCNIKLYLFLSYFSSSNFNLFFPFCTVFSFSKELNKSEFSFFITKALLLYLWNILSIINSIWVILKFFIYSKSIGKSRNKFWFSFCFDSSSIFDFFIYLYICISFFVNKFQILEYNTLIKRVIIFSVKSFTYDFVSSFIL